MLFGYAGFVPVADPRSPLAEGLFHAHGSQRLWILSLRTMTLLVIISLHPYPSNGRQDSIAPYPPSVNHQDGQIE